MKGILTKLLTILFFLWAADAAAQTPVSSALNLLPKKPLPKGKLGLNAFVNDQRFGTISAQFREVRNVLGIKHVRVLFNWNDQVQQSPAVQPFFGFYDEIVSSLPRNVKAVVVLNGAPSWMADSSNWIAGNPRKTFSELWVRKVVNRYGGNKKIAGWQIWNEPNMSSDNQNQLMGLVNNPSNYVELAAFANNIIRGVTKKQKIISAATTAINQNYPDSLNYNKQLKSAGLEELIDIWAVHVYSTHLENFLRPGGVISFIKELGKPVWVTESGERGINEQKSYGQRMWPFLLKTFPQIKRIYIYQFTEAAPASSTYGLRNLTTGYTVSDLYIYLRSLHKNAKKRRNQRRR